MLGFLRPKEVGDAGGGVGAAGYGPAVCIECNHFDPIGAGRGEVGAEGASGSDSSRVGKDRVQMNFVFPVPAWRDRL